MIKQKVCILTSKSYLIGQKISPEAMKSLEGVNGIPVVELSQENQGHELLGTVGIVSNTEIRISKNTDHELWAEVLLLKDINENDKFSCSLELENDTVNINKFNIATCYLHKNGYRYGNKK